MRKTEVLTRSGLNVYNWSTNHQQIAHCAALYSYSGLVAPQYFGV